MKKSIISLVTAFVIIFSCPVWGAADNAGQCAEALYAMGLLSGTGTSADGSPVFELDRAPTRQEAMVMLIRLLGRDGEVSSGSWSHPFEDVDSWADKYVGYAYRMGLAKGTGGARFGGGSDIGAEEYITFVLRALGYSDSEGDFLWERAHELSDRIGLTSGQYSDSKEFTRGDIAIISYNALSRKLKGSGNTLVQSLVNSSAVTKADAVNAGLALSISGQAASAALDAEEIYSRCSPAVFQLIIYDLGGRAFGSGSGFFISGSGTAVTNYHVIKGAASAKAVLSSGAEYQVEGVYDYDEEKDLALIKVAGSGFQYLDVSDAALAGGATVYAIGSPLGLDNSISQGIVSNPKRVLGSAVYVQITAPISPGSSGGALINAYGQAVGVTSAFVEEGQNINLAVPIGLIGDLSGESLRPLGKAVSSGASEKDALQSSHSRVTVSAGNYAAVLLTYASEDRRLLYEITDQSIVSAEFGDWIDGQTRPFYITGISPGNAYITVALEEQNGKACCSLVIRVTVTAAESPDSGDYIDFPGVPDFGEYAFVSEYYSTHTPYSQSVTGYSVGYCYRVEEITEVFGDADWLEGYYKILGDKGFYFSSSFRDDMGFTIKVLENRYGSAILCSGVSYVGSELCFCLVMWENL